MDLISILMKRELRKHGNRINYRDKDQPQNQICPRESQPAAMKSANMIKFFFGGLRESLLEGSLAYQ